MMFINIMTCYAQHRSKGIHHYNKVHKSIVHATMGIERKNNQIVLSQRTLGFQDSVEVYNCTHMENRTNHHTLGLVVRVASRSSTFP